MVRVSTGKQCGALFVLLLVVKKRVVAYGATSMLAVVTATVTVASLARRQVGNGIFRRRPRSASPTSGGNAEFRHDVFERSSESVICEREATSSTTAAVRRSGKHSLRSRRSSANVFQSSLEYVHMLLCLFVIVRRWWDRRVPA